MPRLSSSTPRLLRWLALPAGALVLVWLAFFDSHSLSKRVRWHQEHARLVEENERLQEEISAVEARLEAAPSDSLLERIAREQYGMRRPGETVYRVEQEE